MRHITHNHVPVSRPIPSGTRSTTPAYEALPLLAASQTTKSKLSRVTLCGGAVAAITTAALGMAAVGGACILIAGGCASMFKTHFRHANNQYQDLQKNALTHFELCFSSNNMVGHNYNIRLRTYIDPDTPIIKVISNRLPNFFGNHVTYDQVIKDSNEELYKLIRAELHKNKENKNYRIPQEELPLMAGQAVATSIGRYLGNSIAIKAVATLVAFSAAGALIGSTVPIVGTGFGGVIGAGVGVFNGLAAYKSHDKMVKVLREDLMTYFSELPIPIVDGPSHS